MQTLEFSSEWSIESNKRIPKGKIYDAWRKKRKRNALTGYQREY